MERGIGSDKQKMVKSLQDRLNWYVNEAKDEEYNEAEVQAIKELLKVMEPEQVDESYFTPEKGLERFWQTVETRQEIYDEMHKLMAGEVSLADYPDDDEPVETAATDDDASHKAIEKSNDISEEKKPVRFFRRKGVYRTVIAAALVLALFVGGTVGVYAEKSGFFHWIKRDESGMALITSPESMDNKKGISDVIKYKSLDQVPDEYRNYIWQPESIPEEMEFVYHGILKYKTWDWVSSYYANTALKLRLEFISRVFLPGVEYHSQQYDSYDFLYTKDYNGTSLEFFNKISDDGTEYAVSFLYDNVQYIVQGNLTLSEIEALATECCANIVK